MCVPVFQILNPLQSPSTLALPVNDRKYDTLLFTEKYHTWTVYGFLLCPSALADPAMMTFLRKVLEDSFVVPLYRDEMIYVHERFEELFTWYPPRGSSRTNRRNSCRRPPKWP